MAVVLRGHTLSQCMEAMAELAMQKEQNGERNLIFCEDRLTLIAERALVKKTGGTFLSSVSTFARFLSSEEKILSKQGSVMAVGEVMAKLQRENALQCFTTARGIGNNARCIYETLAQMSASEITSEVLRESLALLPDDMLKRKVSDLALIFEGYEEFLKEGGLLDESSYLSLLPAKIRAEKQLKNTNVFFLCYNSFTAQAKQTIRAALDSAKSVIGVFCGGEEEIYCNKGEEIFCKVCSEYEKTEVRNFGKPLEGEAELLRKGLFNPKRVSQKTETENISVFEGEDKLAECEYVALQIRKAMAEKEDLHYRDFAVLASSVSAYSLSLKKSFSEYGIPYFIDEKKSLKNHPLSLFLLACLRVVIEKYSPTSVQTLAQNFFFGESDEYRNYLLKFANYRGGAKRPIKTGEKVASLFDIEKAESGRERLLLATENIKTKGHGRDYFRAIRKILVDFDVEKRLEKLGQEINDRAQEGYLRQVFKALDGVLTEGEILLGDKELTAVEIEALLKDGFEATEISLIPLRADAVFIGDINDSRIEKVYALFAVGMTEETPRRGTDDSIVSDKEISRLAEVKTLLEPTVAEVNLRSRESVCLNLCAFESKLFLSYPLTADGSEPALSDIFRYLDSIVCSPSGKRVARKKKISESDFPYRCSAVAPAIRQLLIEKQNFEMKKADTRREYSSLFAALDKLSVTEKDDYLKERKGQICVERGEELFFKAGKISPTGLESYFACPFRNFAQNGLKLKEREESAVLAMDTGDFIHALLEKTAPKWEEIDSEAKMLRYALSVGEELMKTSTYIAQQDTASGEYFSEQLLKEGAEVAVVAYRQVKNSRFKVQDTERYVDSEFFHGKVDRVDSSEKYVRVIDYKTGSIDDSATSYYTGQKLQMQLYMQELKGKKTPAGVFYFPASVNYSDEEEGKFCMKGFMNGDEEALLCGDIHLTEEKKSEYFPAALKNGPRAKRVMDEQTFRDFLDYSILVARQGCKELKEGYIAPSPYENKCSYCKFGGMCGFDKDVFATRKESAIDTTTIAKIAKEKRDGKGE